MRLTTRDSELWTYSEDMALKAAAARGDTPELASVAVNALGLNKNRTPDGCRKRSYRLKVHLAGAKVGRPMKVKLTPRDGSAPRPRRGRPPADEHSGDNTGFWAKAKNSDDDFAARMNRCGFKQSVRKEAGTESPRTIAPQVVVRYGGWGFD
jgi:hypothetical protein